MSCVIDDYFKRNIDYKISDLAHYCGISKQGVYLILNSQRIPNVYIAMKMCDYFTILNSKMRRKGYDSFSGRIRLFVSDLWIYDQLTIDDSS